jgi:branched-chain amino acid transport system permease protein
VSAANVRERGGRAALASPPVVKGLLALILFVAVPAALSAIGGGYLYQIATTALIYLILAASLNLVTGTAGLLSLGHAGFYGVGAYVAAILATRLGLPFLVTMPAAGLSAGAIGFLVALPTMRLVSIYFAVATLGIGEMIYVTLLNWTDFTRGPMGIRAIPPIDLLGWQPHSPMQQYLVVAATAALSLWVISRLTHSYYGNALRAVREDDQCASAMGLNVVRLKITAFSISCFFAGVAGALLAHTANFISPDQFQFRESINILAMVVVGGLGSLPGAVIGALLLVILPEALRAVGDFRMIAIGSTMFLSILMLPKGLLGEASALDLLRRQFGQAWSGGGGPPVGWR